MVQKVRIVFFLLGLTGIVLHILHTERVLQLFSYYTMQSNVLAVILWGVLIVKNNEDTTIMRRCRFVLTTGIMITFIVYHFVLVPVLKSSELNYPLFTINDLFVHYFTPLLMFFDYVFLSKPFKIPLRQMMLVWVQPVFYTLYVFIYVTLGGVYIIDNTTTRFPYFFMDIDQYGWQVVLMYGVGILILFIVLGFIIHLMKQLINAQITRRTTV